MWPASPCIFEGYLGAPSATLYPTTDLRLTSIPHADSTLAHVVSDVGIVSLFLLVDHELSSVEESVH